ncbi:MAG: sulfite exporter TauE/SafE family protein [Flexilinea sp.]
MEAIIIAFITGLTTGGLNCLAIQGGLLASCMANQMDKEFQTLQIKKGSKGIDQSNGNKNRGLSILAFLLAKLLAYTILGALLGFAGKMFQLSPFARAFLQIAIGIFMLGTALRMLNVHPIFRYFAFEPPAFLRRRIRKTAAGTTGASLVAPAFLGLLTVFIPCGITQAMMVTALGTGNPLQGAALMFAFTLGTSPVFFGVAYFAFQLGAKLEKHFMRFAAVAILFLAVMMIDSGITLSGSPVSLSRLANRAFSRQESAASVPADVFPDTAVIEKTAESSSSLPEFSDIVTQTPEAAPDLEEGVITVDVVNYGYKPNIIHAKSGIPIKLQLVTQKTQSCSRAFIMPALGVQMILEETGTAVVDIPAQEKGKKINFSCSMGMYGGSIIFDL